jgi:hypothetical protein
MQGKRVGGAVLLYYMLHVTCLANKLVTNASCASRITTEG